MLRATRLFAVFTAASLSLSALAQVPGGIAGPATAEIEMDPTIEGDEIIVHAIVGSFYATEGPIWNVHTNRQTISVVGKTLTTPRRLFLGNTLSGTQIPFEITGSSVLSNDGEAFTGIDSLFSPDGTFNFSRLEDANACAPDSNDPSLGRDANLNSVDSANGLGSLRLGCTRSIFSTSEAHHDAAPQTADPDSLYRDVAAQQSIEALYFDVVDKCWQANQAALPNNFKDMVGFGRGLNGTNLYPVTAGGTLKSAGRRYIGPNNEEYFIADEEMVIELSENVSSGLIMSSARGDVATGRPDSFVMDDLLVIFNQDPRFGADVLGIGEIEIRRKVFYDEVEAHLASNTPLVIDLIGHTVGEHVLFVQEILCEFTDPAAGAQISADRFRLRNRNGAWEARWRGTAAPLEGLTTVGATTTSTWTLHAMFANAAGDLLSVLPGQIEFNVPMQVTAAGLADYDFRERGLNLTNAVMAVMELRDGNGSTIVTAEFPITP